MPRNSEQLGNGDTHRDAGGKEKELHGLTYQSIGTWQSPGGVIKNMAIWQDLENPGNYTLYKQEKIDGTTGSSKMNLGALRSRVFNGFDVFEDHYELQLGKSAEEAARIILETLNWTEIKDQATTEEAA